MDKIRITIFQLLLMGVAVFSWMETAHIGNRIYFKTVTGGHKDFSVEGAAAAITSGFNGGAIAMGMITVVAICSILYLEVLRGKRNGLN